MHRLDCIGDSSLLEMYARASMDFPLIRSVVECIQPGRAYVDHVDRVQLAFVASTFGFAFLFGSLSSEKKLDEVVDFLFSDPELKGRYLLWYNPPKRCRARMDAMEEEVASRRTRIQFSFTREEFVGHRRHRMDYDAHITRIDREILQRLGPFALDIGGRFWPSEEAFLEKGFGFVALIGDRVAAVCYTACVVNGVAEIDVVTDEAFREGGLGEGVAVAFLVHCLQGGIRPNWDCFDYNEPSLRLARRLGFKAERRYPFYSVNT